MDESLQRHLSRPRLEDPGLILLAAAELIERRGLCKGKFEDDAGRLCVLGALITAGGISPHVFRAVARIVVAVSEELTAWNDDPDTTQEMVVGFMRRLGTQSDKDS